MEIKLNEILNLSENEIDNSKIGLNMEWKGRSHFLDWYESNPENRNVDFTYHSHQGNNSSKKKASRNFTKVGQLCFGFVRLDDDPDKWLLVSAGEITSIPDSDVIGTCGHKELERYQGLIGRLVIRYHKGNTFSRYIFKLGPLIDKIVVSDILPNIYEPIKFSGYENVHLKFKTLRAILDGTRYSDYRAALKGTKGVYCLTDSKTGKLYIGSATGEDGILQRWSDYRKNMTGGNKGLIDLLNRNDETYFEEYFEYTLIETFPKSISNSKVIEREQYWKDVFKTREFGYNEN